MGIFAKLRESSKTIKYLVCMQKTAWYPILYGSLCFIGGIHDHRVYIPIMWVLISMHLFAVLFADDNKVFLTSLCMTYFALGMDNPADSFHVSDGDMLSFMHEDALIHLVAMGVIGIGSLIVRLIIDGSVASALKKRGHFTWSILAMNIAFILNGLFSPTYEIANLGYGMLLAFVLTVVYFLVSGMLDNSESAVKYACTVAVCLAYSAFLQIGTVILRLNANGKYIITPASGNPYINRSMISLGWGVLTVVAGIIVLGIPAAMYLAKRSRASLFYYLSCFVFILGTVLVNARNAMVAGAAVFAVCALLCCISGKNKGRIRLYTALSAALAFAVLIYLLCSGGLAEKLMSALRLDSIVDKGRLSLWKNGLGDFAKSPVFGAGFADGGYASEARNNNFYSNMYHCILVEIPGAMGIVGCLAFLMHAADILRLTFKRISVDRLLILCLPLVIILMSLLDNFFFYPQFQILYCVFCVAAERGSKE